MGAERIRPQTIDRFVNSFDACGFRRESLFPCYGLAEATLMVSGGPRQKPPVVLSVDAESLAQNHVRISCSDDSICRTLVGCGENLSGQRIVIVDPHTHASVAEDHVGEIWVQGPSVADGYFENPEATAATFHAHLAKVGSGKWEVESGKNLPLDTCHFPLSDGDGPFLRTGDLGFLHENQLFVTGRLKNLIIIRGRNYYPEDIEQTIDSAHPGLRAGQCAAFSVEVEGREQLVVVQEVEPRQRDLDTGAAIQAIRSAIANRHELEVHAIVLVKAGEVPKTSSGKTRRTACRDRFLHGELETVAAWKSEVESGQWEEHACHTMPGHGAPGHPRSGSAPRHLSAAEIESWLVQRITARLRLASGEVSVNTPFLELGMSSLDALEIAAALECWLERQLSPTAIYNYPTIASLAQWLAQEARTEREKGRKGETGTLPFSPAPRLPLSVASGVDEDDRILAEVRAMSDQDIEVFFARELAKQQQ